MKNKIFILNITMAAVLITASGCASLKTTKDTSGIDGGVFKTADKGNIWQQKVLIPTTSGRPNSFSGANVASMTMDPGDNNAIYFGSEGNGLFYTYDSGNSWKKAVSLGGNVTVKAVAVDPLDKCVIYAAYGNKVFKSEDCSRNWSQIYYDNDSNISATSIAVDHFNSSVIYIGVSRGDILKSSNGGDGWQTVNKFDGSIREIAIDPNDSRIVYVLTDKKGVFRSVDGGETWYDLNNILKELKLGLNIRGIALVKDEPDLIFLATSYGLLRSGNQGESWEKIELITPENKSVINAMAVNPRNPQEIYYVTDTTFFRSLDGGQNWATKKLPTSRAGWALLVNPGEPNIIYIGVKSLKEK